MRTARAAPFAALALLALSAACATGTQRTAEGAVDRTTSNLLVRVEHDLAGGGLMTVWLAPQTGVRQMLGSISAMETKLMRFDGLVSPGEYRLVAEQAGGPTVTSRPFIVGGADVVEWDLSTNIITLMDAP